MCRVLLAVVGFAIAQQPDANELRQPEKQICVVSPLPGVVKGIHPSLKPNSLVFKGQDLILIYSPELRREAIDLHAKLPAAKGKLKAVKQAPQRQVDLQKLQELRHVFNADPNNPGYFWIKAPATGVVVSSDFQEKLIGAAVDANLDLLCIKTGNLKDMAVNGTVVEVLVQEIQALRQQIERLEKRLADLEKK